MGCPSGFELEIVIPIPLGKSLFVSSGNIRIVDPDEISLGIRPTVEFAPVNRQDDQTEVTNAIGDIAHVRLAEPAPGKNVVNLQFQILGMSLRIERVNLKNASLSNIQHQISVVSEEAFQESVLGIGPHGNHGF